LENDKQVFVYTRKLNANKSHKEQFAKRFRMADDIYKKTLITLLKRYSKMKKDPLYKKAYKFPKGKERNAILKELGVKYDLVGKFTASKFANDYRNARNYSDYIPSDTAVKLGLRAWDAFSKVRFAKGADKVNLLGTVTSFEGRINVAVSVKNNIFTISTRKKKVSCTIHNENDAFEEEVLRNTLKYNRFIRRFEFGEWNYYVQSIFEGTLPTKYTSELEGSVGIDIGTSTIAVSSYYQTELEELAKDVTLNQQEVTRLSRKLDRQRRANNPHKYNENGTIKKGIRQPWVDSKEYLKTKTELSELNRKATEQRKLAHKTLANKIVRMGSTFVVEQMSFKGLQARTKETKVNEKTGKYQSKKRFGKIILHKAPSMLIEQIRYKTMYQGKTFILANTREVKASQLNHLTEEYNKVSLGTRAKMIGDELVQRDLYSAFLLQHVGIDGVTVDIEGCKSDFDTFLRNQEFTMSQLTTDLKSVGKDYFN
jgi:hypothetical protein